MFDTDGFIAACRAALAAGEGQPGVRDVVARAVADPAAVLEALGEPRRAQLQTIHRSADLTVLNVVWAPRMTLMPHNHTMWAVIGIYTGREDNIFWRRVASARDGRVEAAGAKAIGERDAVPLGPDVIHSVTNPIPRLTGAIHVYGGDFFRPGRSEWDPESLCEQAYDSAKAVRMFEEANRIYGVNPDPG
jgi:predicted metal-dependent enzyme (double-stranded beta helix superfamily)